MNLTKKRWIVLLVSCFINLCIGSLYAWSVFSPSMAQYLSSITGNKFTAGTLAVVFTVANSVGPITMISGGKINDKFGPKAVVFAGGLMFGAGMIISGFARNIGTLILGYGVLTGLGMGMVYGCTISNSVKFFPDKRGLIGGLTTATYGLSSVIIPPIASAMINSIGVSKAFIIFGTVFLVIICAGAFTMEQCPEGFLPDGFKLKQVSVSGKGKPDKGWKEMLSAPVFYIMIVLLMCGAFCGLMCISQISSIAGEMIGMSAAAATTAVSVLALFNVSGRIAAGYISDRIGRINTLTLALIISLAGLSLLYFSGIGSNTIFYIGIACIGVSFGAYMGVYPGFTADEFGTKNNSVNYGIMFIGFAVAGGFGPTIMSNLHAVSGSYKNAFLSAIALCAAGLVLSFIYRKFAKANKNKLSIN